MQKSSKSRRATTIALDRTVADQSSVSNVNTALLQQQASHYRKNVYNTKKANTEEIQRHKESADTALSTIHRSWVGESLDGVVLVLGIRVRRKAARRGHHVRQLY